MSTVTAKQTSLSWFVNPDLTKRAFRDSFLRLTPRYQGRNPVMFVVEVGAALRFVHARQRRIPQHAALDVIHDVEHRADHGFVAAQRVGARVRDELDEATGRGIMIVARESARHLGLNRVVALKMLRASASRLSRKMSTQMRGFAPAILVMVTSFTRIVVVLSLLRTALGTATAPPPSAIMSRH